jgi:hypothetical protein
MMQLAGPGTDSHYEVRHPVPGGPHGDASIERRFLTAFAEAVLGLEHHELGQAAKAVDRLDKFLDHSSFGCDSLSTWRCWSCRADC